MTPPPPPLMALRTVASLLISAVIGQAGWAAAFLGGGAQYRETHEWWGTGTLVLCWLGALVYLVLRRHAGPVNVVLAVALAAGVSAQYALGEAGATSVHIFVGVLLAMLVTALTSWTFRHPGPADTGRIDRPTRMTS